MRFHVRDDSGRRRPSVRQLEKSLARPAAGLFTSDHLDTLPSAAQQYLTASIAPGTSLARSARLVMRGHIKLKGRWLRFRADQVLAPQTGFVCAARVSGVITGSDQYVSGQGWMSWKLAGLLDLVDIEGSDVSRSGAGRCAGETCWLPTMWLPRFGAAWTELDRTHLTVRTSHDGHDVVSRLYLDSAHHIRTLVFDRWGDPDETGTFGLYPFGMDVTATSTFAGLTIPSEGRVGWFHGTPRWAEGEFFRFHITDPLPTT